MLSFNDTEQIYFENHRALDDIRVAVTKDQVIGAFGQERDEFRQTFVIGTIAKDQVFQYYKLPSVENVRLHENGETYSYSGADYVNIYSEILEGGATLSQHLILLEPYVCIVHFDSGERLSYALQTNDDQANLFQMQESDSLFSTRTVEEMIEAVRDDLLASDLILTDTKIFRTDNTIYRYTMGVLLFTDGAHEYIVFPEQFEYYYNTPGYEYIDVDRLTVPLNEPQFIFESDRLYNLKTELVPFLIESVEIWDDAYSRLPPTRVNSSKE